MVCALSSVLVGTFGIGSASAIPELEIDGHILPRAVIDQNTSAAPPQWLLHSSRHTIGTYSESFTVHKFMLNLADIGGTTHRKCFLWSRHSCFFCWLPT